MFSRKEVKKNDYKVLVEKQRQFFLSGETQPVKMRIQYLKTLKKMVQSNEKRLLKAMQEDLGKPQFESYITELGVLYQSIRHMINKLPSYVRPQRKKTPYYLMPAKSYTLAQSYGNVLILNAYNYPVLLALDPLVGAIAGGNCAIIAVSEHTPHVNKVLFDIIPQYFDSDHIAIVQGGVAENTALLSERFDKIFFTGSTRVGQIVMEAASKNLTPVTLELGGKSPAIVTKHANIKRAAERIAWGKFINTGATCVAPDYCLVDESIKAEFVESLVEAITKMYGNFPLASKDYGRVVSEAQFERLDKLLNKQRSDIVFGGQTEKDIRYIAPTIVELKKNSVSPLMGEEIFGPILPVLDFGSIEEVIQTFQGLPSPLALYAFTEKSKEAKQITSAISFGGGMVNDTILHLANDALPFGGVGASGMGQYHGKYSFEAFTHEKAIVKRSTKFPVLNIMHPPYTKRKNNIIRKVLK